MFRLNRDKPGAGLLLEILMIVVGINIALWFETGSRIYRMPRSRNITASICVMTC